MPTSKRGERLRVFVDRSLGRYEVPQALRDLDVCDVAEQDWVVLTKDRRIVRPQSNGELNPELAALAAAGARVFCFSGQRLGASRQIERLRRHIAKILSIAESREGPYVYAIDDDRVSEIWRPA